MDKHEKYYRNGQLKEKGYWSGDKQVGLWTYWYENGQKEKEGTWKDGKQDGKWTYWNENGQKMEEGNLKDGKKDGLWTEWWSNGQKGLEGTWKDGEQDGKWTYWDENGQKEKEGTWKDGEQDGKWTYWNENGEKWIERTYKDGEIVNERKFHYEYYENGQKKKEGAWKNHKKDGKWTYWSPDGKESTEFTWKNDKEWDGVWIAWSKNGKKKVEETWKDGKLINEVNYLKNDIIELLKDRGTKMPASDIDAHLKHQNVDEIKQLCKELYNDGKISFAGNGRYFVLTEEKEKPKKASAAKPEKVDVKAELKKYKEMLDDGLITQEDYDAKKKELLGL